MIKVLHVISDTGIGGAGILLLNLLRHADRNTFSYTVALPHRSALAPRIEALGIETVSIAGLADCSIAPRALPALLTLIRQNQPQILHTHAGLSARIVGTLCRVPVRVNTKHCAPEERSSLPKTMLRPLQKSLQNTLSTHFIATAEAAGEALLREGAAYPKISLILNGSDAVEKLSEEEKILLRQELSLPQDAFVVGMAARMERGKGQEILLEAAKRCLLEEPRFHFLLAGTGSMEKELRSQAKRLGIADKTTFLGFRADVGRVMNLFDLNVNCSYLSETSSLSLSEGMSLGLVPVVSDVGGNPFMAGFGQNGVIIRRGDPKALAAALLGLYSAPKLRAALSKACISRYEQDFQARHMARQTEALYLSALDKHLSP